MDVWRADNSVQNGRNLPISNPKPDLNYINAHTKFRENPLMPSRNEILMDGRTHGRQTYKHKTPMLSCGGDISKSAYKENCNTFKRAVSLKVFDSFLKGSSLNGSNLLPHPFSEEPICAREKIRSHKSFLLCRQWREIYQVYPGPLNMHANTTRTSLYTFCEIVIIKPYSRVVSKETCRLFRTIITMVFIVVISYTIYRCLLVPQSTKRSW